MDTPQRGTNGWQGAAGSAHVHGMFVMGKRRFPLWGGFWGKGEGKGSAFLGFIWKRSELHWWYRNVNSEACHRHVFSKEVCSAKKQYAWHKSIEKIQRKRCVVTLGLCCAQSYGPQSCFPSVPFAAVTFGCWCGHHGVSVAFARSSCSAHCALTVVFAGLFTLLICFKWATHCGSWLAEHCEGLLVCWYFWSS